MSAPAPGTRDGSSQSDRLDSWKEIAAYLKRDVRTVQRWEKSENLPIRRHMHDKQGTVFAYKAELDHWWEHGGKQLPEPPPPLETDAVTEEVFLAPPSSLIRWKLLVALLAGVSAMVGVLYWMGLFNGRGDRLKQARIAVLPFANLSGDPEQLYFSEGISEEIRTKLSQISPADIGVISRTSSEPAPSRDIHELARILSVQYVVEGSVRHTGPSVRIAVQLIRTSDGTHVWAQSYERELSQVVDAASEVAGDVAGEISERLRPTQKAGSRPVKPAAWEAYQRGRFMFQKRGESDIRRAITYFQDAIQTDPEYAPAYSGLADSYILLAAAETGGAAPASVGPAAKEAAQKAVQLDPNMAEAHTSLGYLALVYDWDRVTSERELTHAIRLQPSYALAHQWYALLLEATGRLDEAIAQLKQAQELAPLSLPGYSALAQAYYFKRDYEHAIEYSQKGLELEPNFVLAHFNMGRALLQKKMASEAIAEFTRARELSNGGPVTTAALAYAYGLTGDRANALKMLGYLRTLNQKHYVPALYFGAIYAAMGDKQEAFLWLEKAYQEKVEYLVFLRQDPIADPIRSDPRFEQFMRRVGF